MRVFSILNNTNGSNAGNPGSNGCAAAASSVRVTETPDIPAQLPAKGFIWISCARGEFETRQAEVQAALQSLCGTQLVDLHISDLTNRQLPSHYDFTARYDVLVFRRLAAGGGESGVSPLSPSTTTASTAMPVTPPFTASILPVRSATRGGPPVSTGSRKMPFHKETTWRSTPCSGITTSVAMAILAGQRHRRQIPPLPEEVQHQQALTTPQARLPPAILAI